MWDLLDKLNTIIGIAVSIPIVWSWYFLYKQKKRQNELIRSMEYAKGNRPVAVLIDLGHGEIENQVRVFLKGNNMDMDILKYSAQELKKETLQDFVDELQKLKARAMEKGCDKIHLFYRGPVVGALIVGEVFSNTAVNIYHLNKDGSYESWGPLHRSFI